MTSNKKSDKFLSNIIEKMDIHDKCKIQVEKQESEITKDVFNIYRFKETQDDLLHQLEETHSYEDSIKNTFFSKIGNQIFHK